MDGKKHSLEIDIKNLVYKLNKCMNNTSTTDKLPVDGKSTLNIKGSRISRKVYLHDFTLDDMNSSEKAKKALTIAKDIISGQRKKIKCLMAKIRRLKSKVITQHSLITHLKDKPFEESIIDFDEEFIQAQSKEVTPIQVIGDENLEYVECEVSFKGEDTIGTQGCKEIEKKYICLYCEKQFQEPEILKRHLKTHLTIKTHHCSKCLKSFNKEKQLSNHILKKHKKEEFNQDFSCYHCGKKFTKRDGIISHLKLCQNEEKHSCLTCNREFKHRTNLLSHLKIHTRGEHKDFCCEYCSKLFVSKRNLNYHIRKHTGENAIKCEYCNKLFGCNTSLKRHVLIHTGEKLFYCDVCSKGFTQRGHLNIHSKIHTGEKTFCCEYCSKKFSTKDYLVNHVRKHTGEKPFKCDVCSKSFTQRTTLRIHLSLHTGEKKYSCTFCNKKFRQQCSLTTHVRTHTGEKPYPCSICLKKFSTCGGLQSHIRSHTGEKPFSCDYCNKRFANSKTLKKHKGTHNINNNNDTLLHIVTQPIPSVTT